MFNYVFARNKDSQCNNNHLSTLKGKNKTKLYDNSKYKI